MSDEGALSGEELLTWLEITGDSVDAKALLAMVRKTNPEPVDDLRSVFHYLADHHPSVAKKLAGSRAKKDAPWLVVMCTSDLGEDIETILLNNPAVPDEGTNHIQDHGEVAQLELVTADDVTPETLTRLSSSRNYRVRGRVAANPLTPADVLATLAHDPETEVWWSLKFNMAVPVAALENLTTHPTPYPGPRSLAAEHPNTPLPLLTTLAAHSEFAVRAGAAGNPNLTPDLIAELAHDSSEKVRNTIAARPDTPTKLLRELADDPNWGVRRATAANPNTPPDVLASFLNDPDVKVISRGLAGNPSTPAETLNTLSAHASTNVRLAVAENPHLPLSACEILAADEVNEVRETLAENLSVPAPVLAVLAGDRAMNVRKLVALNPNTAPDTLTVLSEDPHERVITAVVRNPNCSPDLARGILAQQPARTTNEMLWRYAKSVFEEREHSAG